MPPRPLYSAQHSLPHLPVPPLASTVHKYIDSLAPLLSPPDLAASTAVAHRFLASHHAAVLQRRLEARAADRDSWLKEWWDHAAYMAYRARLVPNVSYFYIHKRGLANAKSQVARAAELVRATVEFKKLVHSEQLQPETIRGQPLCMASYKYLFNAARQPARPSDTPMAFGHDNHHIVVLCNNRYFKVDTRSKGVAALTEAFTKVVAVADGARGPDIGVLTADDRDTWTDARNRLLRNSTNANTIRTIDSAILLVCLDPATDTDDTDDARAWNLWAGGSAQSRGFNRWFDKHQIIVDSTGESGFNGEHSMLDGTPTLRLNEFILASLDQGKIPLEPEASESQDPEELLFEIDTEMKGVIENSRLGFEKEMADLDLHMVTFKGYGKSQIKSFQASPDAYVQLLKQLAYHRLFSRLPATYESCQTRKFLHGRTEVIRVASQEAQAWVEAMAAGDVGDTERERLFRLAVARHVRYAAWAADGQGVDRHLFGLRMLVRTDQDEPVPPIFTDPAYTTSSHWQLSTSNLSSAYLDGWGYGPVVADGFGLSYSVGKDEITWGVTTRRGGGGGGGGGGVGAKEMGRALVDAAEDVRGMLQRANK